MNPNRDFCDCGNTDYEYVCHACGAANCATCVYDANTLLSPYICLKCSDQFRNCRLCSRNIISKGDIAALPNSDNTMDCFAVGMCMVCVMSEEEPEPTKEDRELEG
jgi:hypothetical protein